MKKIKKSIFLIGLIIVGIVVGAYAFTYARYVSNSIWDYYLNSKGFYLSSDYLASSVVKNVNNSWDGESVHFNVENALNQAVITSYDINYNVSCTITGDAASYSECHLNGTNSNTYSGVLPGLESCSNTTNDGIDVSTLNKTDCELGGYTWVSQLATKDLYFDVVLTDGAYELSDLIVNITITSTSPYRKTISGDFSLHKRNSEDNSVTMNYKNYSNYDRLILSNSYAENKCVNISWNSDKLLIANNKNEFSSYLADTSGYINQITLNINAKSSLSYIFYKRDFNMTYNVNEFFLEESSEC